MRKKIYTITILFFLILLSSTKTANAGCECFTVSCLQPGMSCEVSGNFATDCTCTTQGNIPCDGTQCYCDTGPEARAVCGGSCPYPVGSFPNACDFSNYTSPVYNPSGGYCSAACNGTCQWFDIGSCSWQAAPSTCNTAPTSTINGYKVQMPGFKYNSINPNTSATDNLPVFTSWNGSTSNPYSITVPGACTYPIQYQVSAFLPSTYSAGYTKCSSNQAGCTGTDTPANPNFYHNTTPTNDNPPAGWVNTGPGNISIFTNVSVPADNSFVDLWWHYCTPDNWQNAGTCSLPQGQTCCPLGDQCGSQYQIDNCGNTRTTGCSVTCSFFQTYGGDVTAKGAVSNTELPASSYVSGRYATLTNQSNRPGHGQ